MNAQGAKTLHSPDALNEWKRKISGEHKLPPKYKGSALISDITIVYLNMKNTCFGELHVFEDFFLIWIM